MLIIPPPLAAALHRSGHMLLYKLFTYNGGLYWAPTRLFRIQIKCLDCHPPRAKGGICVDTKGLCLAHYLLCRAASEGSFWPEPLRDKCLAGRAEESALEPLSWTFKRTAAGFANGFLSAKIFCREIGKKSMFLIRCSFIYSLWSRPTHWEDGCLVKPRPLTTENRIKHNMFVCWVQLICPCVRSVSASEQMWWEGLGGLLILWMNSQTQSFVTQKHSSVCTRLHELVFPNIANIIWKPWGRTREKNFCDHGLMLIKGNEVMANRCCWEKERDFPPCSCLI